MRHHLCMESESEGVAWRRDGEGWRVWDGRKHGLVSGKQESEQAVLGTIDRYYGIEDAGVWMQTVCGWVRVAMGKDEMDVHVQEAKGTSAEGDPEMRDRANGYVQAGARGERRVFTTT